jgi:hypothetical protein
LAVLKWVRTEENGKHTFGERMKEQVRMLFGRGSLQVQPSRLNEYYLLREEVGEFPQTQSSLESQEQIFECISHKEEFPYNLPQEHSAKVLELKLPYQFQSERV